MNKTVKTIAWICLVLGLLGLAVDVGVYVHARSLMTQRLEAFQAGEFPAFQGRFNDADEDGNVDRNNPRENALNRDDQFQRGDMMEGGRGFNTFSNNRGGFPGGMREGNFGLGVFALIPLLFIASGPVLVVVGAVMLIVNRTPQTKEASSIKKETSKKKESSKKK